MKATNLGLTIAAALLLAACSREQPEGAPREPDPATAAPAEKTTAAEPANEVVVQIAPTQGNTVTGSLALAPSAEGVHVTGAIQGRSRTPNSAFTSMRRATAARRTAAVPAATSIPRRPSTAIPRAGRTTPGTWRTSVPTRKGWRKSTRTPRARRCTASPETDVVGKAIVVHESPDDYTTQPSGNSGKRVACGVIAAPSPQ